MLYSPIISNMVVTKTLINCGAGLNILSVQTFNRLQVPYSQLQPTKPFSGITDGSTVPIGQVRLPVTFGARDNYRTELIDSDVSLSPSGHATTTAPSSSTPTSLTFACRTTPSSGTQRWPSSWQ